VTQARSGTSPELEAVTAERDFFREKYAEQIDAMEDLKGRLKESQRVIDKLRSQVLDLEIEKCRFSEGVGEVAGKSPKQIGSIGGSTDTSVTCLTCEGEDESLRSGVHTTGDCAKVDDRPVGEDNAACPTDKETGESKSVPAVATGDADSPEPKDDDHSTPGEDSSEDEESCSDDVEADKIRANAERMLLWANYKTSKHSTPNTSVIQDSTDGLYDDGKSESNGLRSPSATPSSKVVSDAIVYSLPTSLDKRQMLLDDDDDSSLGVGSSSRQNAERSVGSWRSGTASSNKNGRKIGNLFNNLRDMIDPPPERDDSESESDDESTDSFSH